MKLENDFDLPRVLDLFARYIDHVGYCEGTTFLDECDWTPEEWGLLKRLDAGDLSVLNADR